jgi:hypothetical protein
MDPRDIEPNPNYIMTILLAIIVLFGTTMIMSSII